LELNFLKKIILIVSGFFIFGENQKIGSVFLLLVLIFVYRRFKLSRKREYLK